MYAILLSSCTKELYSHDQVMQQFKTKKELIDRFGLPTEKRQEGNITEWLYDFGNASKDVSTVRTTGNGALVTNFNSYRRYLKFEFDENGTITKTFSQGVDLSIRVRDKAKTTTVTLMGAAVAVGLVASLKGN